MRSLLIATAICAIATLTGCSFTISGPCTTLSHQSRLNGECGCNADGGCDTCTPGAMMASWEEQPECPPMNFGEGMPNGMEGSASLLDRIRARRASCGCDEQVPCGDEGCGCDESFVSTQQGLGMGLFEKGPMCTDGSCGTGFGSGLLSHGRPHLAARAKAAMASHGCGQMGCGRNGQLCMGCLSKLSALRGPTRGTIPRAGDPNCGPGGGPGVAPSYVYPYYTTRGPRDFLQDGCGGTPILPSAPRKSCLPSIGW